MEYRKDWPSAQGDEQTQEQLQVLFQHPTQEESSLSTMNFLWTQTA